MKIILTDFIEHDNLKPLTLLRAVADIRIGITTIREKWQVYLNDCAILSDESLRLKYPFSTPDSDYLLVRAAVLPTPELVAAIKSLQRGQSLLCGDQYLAEFVPANSAPGSTKPTEEIQFSHSLTIITQPYHIFQQNGAALEQDFARLTAGRSSAPPDASCTIIGDLSRLFIEPGATVLASTINTTSGSVYIGANAEVMEGCNIRGGLALCEGAVLKMGAKIYGPTTIGPHCKVGGEVSNSVFFGFSNKGHDGFVGNSVIGEWCNLGADTNTSNLKNNYSNVKLYSMATHTMHNTDVQFCGTIMGDHSRTGINTMLNTATVTGVCANIFGSGFPPKHIPSFSWGGEDGFDHYDLEKAFEACNRMMERRGQQLTDADRAILTLIAKNAQ